MNTPTDIELLQTAGLRKTEARLALLSILKHAKTPLDVDEIAQELKKRKVDADQVTIYRILDAFVERTIAARLEFQEGKFRYELRGGDHHHLICEHCGRIEDMHDCPISEFETAIYTQKKFSVKRHSLEFFGLCANCAKLKKI